MQGPNSEPLSSPRSSRLLKRLSEATKYFALTTMTLVATSLPGPAQSVDAKSEIDGLLRGQGLVQKRRSSVKPVQQCKESIGCQGNCTHTYCSTVNVPYEEVYSDYLHIGSVDVAQVTKMEYSQPIINSIPEKLHIKSFNGANCTEVPQTVSTTLSQTVTTEESISWNRTVATGISFSAGINVNLGKVGTTSASLQVSKSVTVSDGTQSSESHAVSYSEAVNRVIPPMRELWGEMKVVESHVSVPFIARVVVDGPVDANLNNIGRVSQVLSESQRTFIAEGVLQATTSSDETTNFYDKVLTTEDCKGSGGFRVSSLDGSSRVLPLLAPKSASVVATNPQQPAPNTLPVIELAGVSVRNTLSLVKTVPISKDSASVALPSMTAQLDAQNTPSFLAAGQHQCQSAHNIGYFCQANGIGFNDCNEASIKLQMDDCCSRTQVCGPDYETGQTKCEFGGTSIGFTMSYCLPQ